MQTPSKRIPRTPSPFHVKRGTLGAGMKLQSSVWLTEAGGGKDAPEMPRSHKGLVDTCFEEGHCESLI